MTTLSTVELLSVSTVEFPVTQTVPASEELAVGPLSCSSKYRCAWLFTVAERPEEAAPRLELRPGRAVALE